MKFSIIIPVYNVAPYLRECLDSVIVAAENLSRVERGEQVEVICVDDGSTDGSGAILDEYAKKDARFRVIHQANAGVSAARNRALKEATGEYVGFVDGDDTIHPSWFEVASRLIEDHDLDLLRLRFSTRRATAQLDSGMTCRVVDGEANVLAWGWETYVKGGWSVLNFIRRSCIPLDPYPQELRVCEDNIFLLSLLPNLKRVGQGEFAGYNYRKRESSAVAHKVSTDEAVRVVSVFTSVAKEQHPNTKVASILVRNMRDWWVRTFALGDTIKELTVALSSARMVGCYEGVSSRVALIALIAVEYLKRLERLIVGRRRA